MVIINSINHFFPHNKSNAAVKYPKLNPAFKIRYCNKHKIRYRNKHSMLSCYSVKFWFTERISFFLQIFSDQNIQDMFYYEFISKHEKQFMCNKKLLANFVSWSSYDLWYIKFFLNY